MPDTPAVLSKVASLFAALKRTIEKIADPFDTDEFRRKCPAPPGYSRRLHCCRRGSLPPNFECGIWTRAPEVPPQLRELIELGLNDCDIINWPREALTSKDQPLAALWDPLPPPGYSAFELMNELKRPANVDPVTFMINQLISLTMEKRYYKVEYHQGEEVRKWLENDELTARTEMCPRYSVEQILEFLCVPGGLSTLYYIQRLYEIEFVRRFRPFETSFLIKQFRGGLTPIYPDSPAYVYLRSESPALLPEIPKLRVHPRASYSRVFEFDQIHPLNHVYVAFANTPHHLYCLPMKVTLLDFAILLSVLTPVGRQCVCEFYNKRGRIPAVLYWTWVAGASQTGEGFNVNRIFASSYASMTDCFAASIPLRRDAICDIHCRADCGANIILRSKLKLDEFSDSFEWVLPNLLTSCTTLFWDYAQWSPTGPNLVMPNITNCGILGPDYTSIVASNGRYYYRVVRHGMQRDIPLTRYPSHADLMSEELQRAVDQVFAPTANAAERTVEGESPLSNPALSSAGSARV